MQMSEIYNPLSWRLFEELDVSLDPEGPDQLMKIADRHVARGGRALDVGCRDARYLIALADRFDLRGVAIDPVPWHIERAAAAIDDAGLAARLSAELGGIEDYAPEAGSFDLIWCRDVIEVLPDLDGAVARMAALMAPEGVLIAFTNILSGPPDERETQLIHEPLGNVVDNLVESNLTTAFERHGLAVVERIEIGTEWREFLEEREQIVSRDLLRLARLRRSEERIVAEYGESTFRLFEASTQWATHQFLGRFVPMIYILRHGRTVT